MPYIFGKLWHLAIIWAIRKAFQCILQGVRILLAKYTRISPTSENESYLVMLSEWNICDSGWFVANTFVTFFTVKETNNKSREGKIYLLLRVNWIKDNISTVREEFNQIHIEYLYKAIFLQIQWTSVSRINELCDPERERCQLRVVDVISGVNILMLMRVC